MKRKYNLKIEFTKKGIDENNEGEFYYDTNTIKVRSTLTQPQKIICLVHEFFHFLFYVFAEKHIACKRENVKKKKQKVRLVALTYKLEHKIITKIENAIIKILNKYLRFKN